MLKFQRSYRLEVEDDLGDIQIIEYPLTLDFTVERNTMASANTGDFTIFNLSENTRNLIKKCIISLDDLRTINFYAGYGSEIPNKPNLPLVFSGLVNSNLSTRESGSVDWMTNINAKDPGIPISGDAGVSFGEGSFQKDNVTTLITQFMPGIEVGRIGGLFDAQPTLLRGNTYSGSAMSILRKITNDNIFIDNGKAYILAPNECLPSQGYDTIDASTGLLGSPSYDGVFVNVNVVFEPRIVMGQYITLDSKETWLNGKFKVVAYSHSGRISGSSGGECVTQISLNSPRDSQGLVVLS